MKDLLFIAMLVLNSIAVYLGVIALFTFKKRTPYPPAAPDVRFAVIIPARNEANVIGNLLRALREQDYPADRFDVYVAINHCVDDTAAIAEAAGARIIQCSDAVHCKGDVLHEAFEFLLPQPYDAYAIFDADNLPEPAFLQRMNDALAAGERVCKGRLKGSNPTASWVSGGYALYHTLMEWTYSRPHSAAGFSSNLVGTGFAVHREVIAALGGWNTVTICEDTEFAAQATRIGYRVAWVQEAVSLDEQVPHFGLSLRQRHRWCYGMVQSARLLGPRMFRRDNPRPGMARDFGMLFIICHTQPIATILMLVSLFFQPPLMLLLSLLSVPLSYIAMILLALLLCRLGGYPTRSMLPTILLFPLFMASWIPLQILALIIPVHTWHPIPHAGVGGAD